MCFFQFKNLIKAKNLGSTSSSTGMQPCGWSKRQQFQDRKQHLLAGHRQQQFEQQIAKAE